MEIFPPHAHINVLPLFSAGRLPTKTLGVGLSHDPAGTGMHGIGVRTPKAAAVAAETMGLAKLLHMPKGGIFAMGVMSVSPPTGWPPMTTFGIGKAVKGTGISPKGHCIIAPVQTQKLNPHPPFGARQH